MDLTALKCVKGASCGERRPREGLPWWGSKSEKQFVVQNNSRIESLIRAGNQKLQDMLKRIVADIESEDGPDRVQGPWGGQ